MLIINAIFSRVPRSGRWGRVAYKMLTQLLIQVQSCAPACMKSLNIVSKARL